MYQKVYGLYMILIQKAIVKRKNKFLITLRSSKVKYFPEHWDFPGGKLEPNEDPSRGVEREVLEETNLKVKALKIVCIYNMDLDNSGRNTHKFTVHSTKIISGNIKLSHEHTKFQWATEEEILKLKIEPYIKLYFDKHH